MIGLLWVALVFIILVFILSALQRKLEQKWKVAR
jgi:ABC-type amino acid transport system permease subunit